MIVNRSKYNSKRRVNYVHKMNNILSSVVLISFFMINNAFSNVHMIEQREFSPRLLPNKLQKDLSNNQDFKNDNNYFNSINKVSPTDYKNYVDDSDSSVEADETFEPKDIDEMKAKYKMLLKMLEDPRENQLPIIYFEPIHEPDLESSVAANDKRSGHYFQKYPTSRKRQHTTKYRSSRVQNNYNADLKNLCVPTREDVLNLLTSLHESRTGSERTVHFCNRKRPAKAIFTNIRFLG